MASMGSAARDAYDEETAVRRPLELDGRDAAAASSSDHHRPGGNVMPRYQVGSTKGDSSSRQSEEWRKPSTDDVRKSKPGSRYFTAFGVDLSPDNLAVAIVYFVQGVLGLARLAVSFYLKDDLHLDPAETAVVTGFSSLPWLIKPLYGFISDSIPLFGYRRRSYLFLSGLLGALSWSLMATVVSSKYSAASSILLGSLSVAFSDVLRALLAQMACVRQEPQLHAMAMRCERGLREAAACKLLGTTAQGQLGASGALAARSLEANLQRWRMQRACS